MKYKLVAIDLDGTLLCDDKKLSEDNIYTLRKISNMGIEIVIATGRRYWSAKNFVKELNVNLTIMANNGNIVRQMADDKILISKYLDKEDFYVLIKESRKRGLYPILHVDHYEEGYDILIEFDSKDKKYSSYMSKNLKRYKRIRDFLEYNDPKVLVTCYLGEFKILEKFEKGLHEIYPNKYNSHIMNNLTSVGPILEVMNPLGSKWDSLREYASRKGIEPSEIIAIGDDNNDIEMIKNARLGIGMKNCSKEVKKVADIITENSNNKSGVAWVLRKVLGI